MLKDHIPFFPSPVEVWLMVAPLVYICMHLLRTAEFRSFPLAAFRSLEAAKAYFQLSETIPWATDGHFCYVSDAPGNPRRVIYVVPLSE
jgi:hypothetical protein